MLLENKVAIITGAAQGIGLAIVEKFAAEGASIALCDINFAGIEKIKKTLKNNHNLHKAYKVDVSDISQIVDVVENISIDFGHIDILVNNAGIFFRRDLTNMSFQDWDLMMIVNARSVFYFSQAAAKCFIRQKTGGKIINVSSISGEIVQSAGKTHYASAKAAVIHLSKCIALELAPYRISVNVLSPGPTETPQIAPYDPKDYLERHYIPLGRMALPEDQANGALFFASDLATHITGQVLHIDGGEVMSRIHPLSYQ